MPVDTKNWPSLGAINGAWKSTSDPAAQSEQQRINNLVVQVKQSKQAQEEPLKTDETPSEPEQIFGEMPEKVQLIWDAAIGSDEKNGEGGDTPTPVEAHKAPNLSPEN